MLVDLADIVRDLGQGIARLADKINALATLMIAAVSVAAVIGWWVMHREERKRQRDAQLALQKG